MRGKKQKEYLGDIRYSSDILFPEIAHIEAQTKIDGTYLGHIISKVHIMVPFQVRKGISQPDHINIIVHNIVTKLQNMQ